MSKDGTQAKGWHDDFASDRPEHARRQEPKRCSRCNGKGYVRSRTQRCTGSGPPTRCPRCRGTCTEPATNSFASPTGPDTRQEDEDRWRTIAEEMPAPHARYRVYRKGIGDGFFDATPCYGMHSPWWVPRNAFTKEESPPAEMQKTDLWQPLPQPPESES